MRRRACGDGSSWEGGQSSPDPALIGGWSREDMCRHKREKAGSLDDRAYNLMDPVVADECLSTLGIGDEHKLH